MPFDFGKFATRFMGASFKFPVRKAILVREIEHRVYGKREVLVISRINMVEVGVISRRP